MQLNEIPTVVLLLVTIGILIGVGVLVLDEFGNSSKVSTDVSKETVTVSGATASLANDDVTALTRVENETVVFLLNNDTAENRFNVTTAGVLSSFRIDKYNVSYTYDADSATTTVTASARDATDDFVTWLPIIIIVLAAGIILVLVMRSFKQ